MTMEFNAYIFDTYEAAEAAVQQCDDYYGFPIEGTHTTAEPFKKGEKWLIFADELTIPVLGNNYYEVEIHTEEVEAEEGFITRTWKTIKKLFGYAD